MLNGLRHTGPRGAIRRQIEDLLDAGFNPTEITRKLGCDKSYPERIQAGRIAYDGKDSSCPKFAHHADHVEAALAAGGFATIVGRTLVYPARPGHA